MWSALSIFSDSPARRFGSGETVFRSGARVSRVFLVRRGMAALIRPLPSGEAAVLQRAVAGEIVAEASVYADEYHCDCVAVEDTELAAVPREAFRALLRSDADLNEAWAAHLARGVQRARMRAEIRSLKTVAERLDAWLGEYGDLPPKGQWQTLAFELSVSREALYRELARRRTLSC